jgi:hypothetical protein
MSVQDSNFGAHVSRNAAMSRQYKRDSKMETNAVHFNQSENPFYLVKTFKNSQELKG